MREDLAIVGIDGIRGSGKTTLAIEGRDEDSRREFLKDLLLRLFCNMFDSVHPPQLSLSL